LGWTYINYFKGEVIQIGLQLFWTLKMPGCNMQQHISRKLSA